VSWLEGQIELVSAQVTLPRDFIVPGDSPAGAALALARTIVRRAERQVAGLVHAKIVENLELLRYLKPALVFMFRAGTLRESDLGESYANFGAGRLTALFSFLHSLQDFVKTRCNKNAVYKYTGGAFQPHFSA